MFFINIKSYGYQKLVALHHANYYDHQNRRIRTLGGTGSTETTIISADDYIARRSSGFRMTLYLRSHICLTQHIGTTGHP